MINWPFTDLTPTVPKFYWDVKSQEQRIKIMCILIQQLIEVASEWDSASGEIKTRLSDLETLFKEFQEHGFDKYYEEQIEKWFSDNAFEIYKLIAKQIFFGLTDDGYFCAYVPDSWSEIEFDTGATYGTYTYGRLLLRYNVDGTGVIDNTGYGESISPDQYQSLLADISNMKKTLYTALSKDNIIDAEIQGGVTG
jgi:hypothetical protein